MHYTVIHKGDKGKVTVKDLQKQLTQASDSFRGKAMQDLKRTCRQPNGNEWVCFSLNCNLFAADFIK